MAGGGKRRTGKGAVNDDERSRRGEERSRPGRPLQQPAQPYQQLPTEVLTVASEPIHYDPNAPTRATRRNVGDFAVSPPTEQLSPAEVARISGRRIVDEVSEPSVPSVLTAPEPFKVDSFERALHEAAREPTQHDLIVGGSEPDGPSSTSTEAIAPRPVSFLDPPEEPHGTFDDRTVALDEEARSPGRAKGAFLEATDEDAAAVRTDPSLELPAPPLAPAVAEPAIAASYYDDIKGAFNHVRVVDLGKPAAKPPPAGSSSSDESWPEITIPPVPAKRQTSSGVRARGPWGLVLWLVLVLVVTVGGVRIGYGLSRGTIAIPAGLVRALPGLGSTGAGAGEPASASADVPTTTASPTTTTTETTTTTTTTTAEPPAPGEPAPDDATAPAKESAPEPPGLDVAAAWAERTVQIHVARVDDASKSGVPGMADVLGRAFAGALDADKHAKWRVVPKAPKKGYGFDVSLALLSVDASDAAKVKVECALAAQRVHKPKGAIKASESGEARGGRDAARICSFRLAFAFFEAALKDAD